MKSNLLRIFFEWALVTSVLMSVGFFAWFYFKSHSARAYEVQIATAQAHLQNNRAVVGQLNYDCQVYGKTNAEFQRFLTPPAQPAAAPTKPATK
jgi:hypothetical protein